MFSIDPQLGASSLSVRPFFETLISPTRADHVMEDLGGSDIMILNGDAKGVCSVGIESTVAKIDVANDRIIVLRMGGVTQARLREVLAEGGEEFATMGVHAGSIAGGKVITMETKAECQDQEAETRLERDEVEGQAPGLTESAQTNSFPVVD